MGERAVRLGNDLKATTLTGPARALAEQAVIQMRRLEELALFLDGRGDAWMRLRQVIGEQTEIQINISGALREERELSLAMGITLERLGKMTGAETPAEAPSFLDELASRRQGRSRVHP